MPKNRLLQQNYPRNTPTPVPPTATNTPEPPTAEPTEAPAESAAQDPLAVLVSFEDPADGEALFNENHTLPDGQVWACSTCHNVDVDEIKIGPSLLGLPPRAGETVEGLSDVRYIYNSIVDPQEHIVEGFEDLTLMACWLG